MSPVILVVDDYQGLRTLLAKVLTDLGYEVDLAPDGQAALDRIAERAPDLVLADVSMPHLDGLGLIRALQTLKPELPVVLMSEDETAWWAMPEVPFLAKPFDLSKLRATIAAALELAKTPGTTAALEGSETPSAAQGGTD